MEKILKWSIEAANSDGSKPIPPPDPALLNQLFGGKDEAQLMKDSMALIKSDQTSKEQKLTAFDDLEMLVESLDNANNLEPLNLWQDLISFLDYSPTEDDNDALEYAKMACWIIGTAVQNNPKAQKHLLESRPLKALPKLLSLATLTSKKKDEKEQEKKENGEGKEEEGSSEADPNIISEVANKALYALTSELGHNKRAYDEFVLEDGWKIISDIITSPLTDEKVRTRCLNLLRAISASEFIPEDAKDPETAERSKDHLDDVRKSGIVPHVIDKLPSYGKEGQKDSLSPLQYKTLDFLQALNNAEFKFTPEEKQDLTKLIQDLEKEGLLERNEYELPK